MHQLPSCLTDQALSMLCAFGDVASLRLTPGFRQAKAPPDVPIPSTLGPSQSPLPFARSPLSWANPTRDPPASPHQMIRRVLEAAALHPRRLEGTDPS